MTRVTLLVRTTFPDVPEYDTQVAGGGDFAPIFFRPGDGLAGRGEFNERETLK